MGNACGKADLNNAQIYCQQPKIHYDQLNTENDLKGKIVIESILRPSRDVLGQPPVDMAANPVDWSEYGLDFKNIKRPIPEDFPAFEIRGGGPRASVEGGTPISSAEKKSRNSKVESASKNAPKESSKQSPAPAPAPATPSKSTQTLVKQNSKTSKSGDQSKNTNSKDKEKDKTAAANKKRVSRNVDMDDCSLEGD